MTAGCSTANPKDDRFLENVGVRVLQFRDQLTAAEHRTSNFKQDSCKYDKSPSSGQGRSWLVELSTKPVPGRAWSPWRRRTCRFPGSCVATSKRTDSARDSCVQC